MIRVTHARYFITVPGLEQHCSKVQFQGGINPVPGGIHPVPGRSGTTFQVAIRGICSGSTTTYVGESDNAGSHSCSSTTVLCYTCYSRWTVYAGCDRAHDCCAKGLSWVPYYITAGQYDYTDLRLSWELGVWLLWRMFECLVLDICLYILYYFLIRAVEFAVLWFRYSSQLSLRLTSCYTFPGFCNMKHL